MISDLLQNAYYSIHFIVKCSPNSNLHLRFVATLLDVEETNTPEQGFISHNDVLPSDLSLDIVTKVGKLKTSAAIILSVSADRPVLDSYLRKSLSILVHPEADSGTKVDHQVKVTSEQEFMIRSGMNTLDVIVVKIVFFRIFGSS